MGIYPRFSELLNRHLQEQDRNGSWLARQIGVHPSTVNKWRSPQDYLRPGSLDSVSRIADALGLEAKERKLLLVAAGYLYEEPDIRESAEDAPRDPDTHDVLRKLTGLEDLLRNTLGLTAIPSLPGADDIAAVMEQVQPALDAAAVPACIMDDFARLHSWNNLFVSLSGLEHDEMAILRGQAIWQLWHDDRMPPSGDGLDAAVLEEVRQTYVRLAAYAGAPGLDDLVDACGEPFLTYWRAAGEMMQDIPQPTIMPLTAVSFHLMDVEYPLYFYAHKERIVSDERFEIIHFIPEDATSLQWLEAQRTGL